MEKQLKINDLNVMTQVLQQYRHLRLNGSKFFYYSYAKLDIRLQALERDSIDGDARSAIEDGKADLQIRVSFAELETLFQSNRVQRRDIERIKHDLIKNSHFEIVAHEITNIFFIYERITINHKEQYISVDFNEHALYLHELTRCYPFTKLIFDDMVHLASKYEINLYTYAMTLLRDNSGIITRHIDDLRDLLAPDNESDDYVFINRFITAPAKKITNNQDINLKIITERKGSNITFKVSKRK